MAHLNLKLFVSGLYSFYNPTSFNSIRRLLKSKPHARTSFNRISTVVAAAGRRKPGKQYISHKRGMLTRTEGTPENATGKKRTLDMEVNEEKGFNKKRLEGLDKGAPKQLKLKARSINPVNTICYVQILGTGMDTQDTSPSVLLFFDQQRFIFNAGEGLQRFSAEHKFKLSRLDHIFLTRVCSETAGGIPGLLLTMAGIGDDGMTVNIWGPSDLEYLTGAMRSFIPNSAVVHTNSFGPGHVSEERAGTHNLNGSISRNPIVLVKDEIVQISAVVLLPDAVGSCRDLENSTKISKEANNKDEEESTNLAQKRPRLGSERLSEIEETNLGIQARYKPGDIAVVYICELPDINGKFDPSKARALGLRPGPKYRDLQLGNSVMSDSGNVMVHPSDVMGPSSPGPIVLLVDCPTISHLSDLLSAPAFNKFFPVPHNESENLQKHVNCVIHLTPASVSKYPEYVQWMSKFGDAQHIMAGHEEKNMEFPILKSSARISTRLNFLCPQLFPVPGFRSLNVANNSEEASVQMSQVHGSIPAANLLKFRLRPYARLGLDQSSVPSLPTASDIIDDLLSEIPEIVDASKQIAQLWIPVPKEQCERTQPIEPPNSPSTILEEPWLQKGTCKSELESENKSIYDSPTGTQLRSPNELECCNGSDEIPVCLEGISRDVMEMVFLGTGSSQPSKYRNVSAIFINLFSQGGILLDCGEGTLAQLKRRFGVRGADDVIKSLKFIWISHIHADHHTGLARILSLREQLLKNEPHESLLVIGPRPLKRFLDAYSRVEDLGMRFMDCRQTVKESMDTYEQISHDAEDHTRSNKQHIKDSGDGSGQLFKKDMTVGSNLVWFKPENKLEALNVGQSRMQSYWQRPDGSVLDITGLQKLKKVLSEAGLDILTSVPVVHCPQAFGVVLQAASRKNNANKTMPGWKLVYSGDTRPCQALIDAACGATVLIHEATFDDSMPEEAVSKNHSLTKEAIEVGASAGAYRIILTHFSQRYPKIPVFDESFMDRTCIAFDLMTVNLADLPFVPKINPFLKLLFKNEMAAEEGFESEKITEDAIVEL